MPDRRPKVAGLLLASGFAAHRSSIMATDITVARESVALWRHDQGARLWTSPHVAAARHKDSSFNELLTHTTRAATPRAADAKCLFSACFAKIREL